MVALFVAFLILGLLTLDWIVVRWRTSRVTGEIVTPVPLAAEATVPMPPPSRFLSPGHAWARLEDDGTWTVGTDGFPALLLGDDLSVEVVPRDEPVGSREVLARLLSGGRSVGLRSPVQGKVVAVNPRLGEEPGLCASDPWGDGWLCRVAPDYPARDLASMRVADDAVRWTRQQLARLRERLAGSLAATDGGVTLPDGGAPLPGVARLLEESTWNRLESELFSAAENDRRDPS